ncbi:hypothetical protein L917_12001 [Phytophthora nicotianae]|uniref:Uncharacterized protein n=1 Tax=Phytophthora nicotianae TaxID=4792 RepID=W2KUV1_PHYNI|nr:hypothetical protein L917_12001 [Phytophthora nicotianae]
MSSAESTCALPKPIYLRTMHAPFSMQAHINCTGSSVCFVTSVDLLKLSTIWGDQDEGEDDNRLAVVM